MLESTKLNHEVFNNIKLSSHENTIIKSQESFYEIVENILLFLQIVTSESIISIRLIDYFVTKYAKLNKISYKLKENNIENTFNVYLSYKQQLKAYQKKHFDPFSRGDRIPYFMNDSCIITTIGQLNFFKWFISKKVYEYVLANYNAIENDMNKKNKINKKVKKELKPNKKQKTFNNYQSNFKTAIQNDITECNNNIRITNPTSATIIDTKYHNSSLSFTQPKTDKIIVSFSFN
jgi:hypothetical protein